MKQTIFMIALTAAGALGAIAIEPFVGVAVYYLFAVLRPQAIWEWALPYGVGWSEYVAWPTIAATVWFVMTNGGSTTVQRPRLTVAHKAFLLFGAWLCLTYVTAQDKDIAWRWLLEYLKIFIMFLVAALAVHKLQQVWRLYVVSTLALIYIAYEMNFLYFTAARLNIYHSGYGGLDNNGAGLMLAMAVPLAIHGWEAINKPWRWLFIAGVPVLLHAVLMSYSRGAMVALVVAAPLFILRSRRKRQFAFVFVALLASVPYLAGAEIRDRFFSVENYQTDATAGQRFDSWNAAIRIANDYPVFGAGIRNSNLLTLEYGADLEGRSIHSQYLQTLADTGYPGLFLYLFALACTWVALSRTRRAAKKRDDLEAKMVHSMVNGVEGALFIFCFGAVFLSLEVFELPYILVFLGAQIAALTRRQTEEAPSAVSATAHVPVPLHQRA